MTSGVYILKFGDKYQYIGKADNIERRWEQHRKSFEKGTHTKKLQWAYDSFGPPEYTIGIECHQDHIDLVESLLIEQFWDNYILNGNQPRKVSMLERAILASYTYMLEQSTTDHIKKIVDMETGLAMSNFDIEQVRNELQELKDEGIVLPHEVAEQLTELQGALKEKNKELERLSKLSWFDRLFNFKVLC